MLHPTHHLPSNGALSGIRVVDFGQYIANATWNRGKACLQLDLKQPHGHAEALGLIAAANTSAVTQGAYTLPNYCRNRTTT